MNGVNLEEKFFMYFKALNVSFVMKFKTVMCFGRFAKHLKVPMSTSLVTDFKEVPIFKHNISSS